MTSAMAFYESLGEPFTEADMPPPPKHCTSCGRALIRREEQPGYRETGAKDIVPTWRCPMTVGWVKRLLMVHLAHDEYEPDKFFGPYWRKRHYS